MSDLEVRGLFPPALEAGTQTRTKGLDLISDFRKILDKSVKEVNTLLLEADQSAQQMLLGKMDIHQAMVAIEKANVSFRFLLQVRNKMMAAYEEIMRMQL